MKRLFLEADELGQWTRPFGVHESWQDHGAGLLATLARQHGYSMDILSLKAMHSWAECRMAIKPYDLILMNVRSWRYPWAKRAAEIAKVANPNCQVWAGGFHNTVALAEMEAVPQFDLLIRGEGEQTLLDLLGGMKPAGRVIKGKPCPQLDDLPFMDRGLWPRPPAGPWPLEGTNNWGPGKVAATMLTGRSCPWHCSFCYPAERDHFGKPKRRSVGNILEELGYIKASWGEFSTVLFHDSEFLMHRQWLEEFVERYPREAGGVHFWASCRADMICRWQDLVEAMVRDCNWHCLSIGLESGSDRVLKAMNKETTAAQNLEAIEIANRLGDELEAQGKLPCVVFANIMLATPGEEPEDAFATIRMLGRIKRCVPSMSFFTPYPGSLLGNRAIAEGKSLDVGKKYLRFPNEAKVAGVDYQFYADLFNGKYDGETGVPMQQVFRAQGSPGMALV